MKGEEAMDKLISVIVAAYNVAPWLSRCIESILAQTYKNLEIILIDDGSTDEMRDLLQLETMVSNLQRVNLWLL